MKERLLTIDELSKFTQVSSARIYNMISQGREGEDLPRSIKIGRSRRWPESEVYEWVKRQLESGSCSQVMGQTKPLKKTINRI